MSIEVVRSEASSRGIWSCALCRNGQTRVWRYCKYIRNDAGLLELAHLYLCHCCADSLGAALSPKPVTPEPDPEQSAESLTNQRCLWCNRLTDILVEHNDHWMCVACATAPVKEPEQTQAPEQAPALAGLRWVYVVLYRVMAGGRWDLWGGAYTTRDGALLQLGRLVEKGYTGQGHVVAVDLEWLDKEPVW